MYDDVVKRILSQIVLVGTPASALLQPGVASQASARCDSSPFRSTGLRHLRDGQSELGNPVETLWPSSSVRLRRGVVERYTARRIAGLVLLLIVVNLLPCIELAELRHAGGNKAFWWVQKAES